MASDISAEEDLSNRSPIHGVAEAPDLPANDAAAAVRAAAPELASWDLASSIYLAECHCDELQEEGGLAPLTRDEAIAVHLYTQGNPPLPPQPFPPLSDAAWQRRRCTNG